MPRVRRRRRVRDLLPLEVGKLLVRRIRLDDDDQVVALKFLRGALDRKWNCAGEIDRESRRAGRESGDVQTARAHRLDLRRVGLNLIEHDLLVETLGKIRRERLEDIFVDGRVFYWRVGEDDRRRV